MRRLAGAELFLIGSLLLTPCSLLLAELGMRRRGALGCLPVPDCPCVFFFTLSLYEVGRRIWKDATDDGEWDVDNSAFLLVSCPQLSPCSDPRTMRRWGSTRLINNAAKEERSQQNFLVSMLHPYPTTAHFLYSV
ncbi:hypothetical protein V8F06_001010 [Rhypophila decipiens]